MIEFHGGEGFTEAEATRTRLLFSPLDELVCGGSLTGVREGGSNERGVGVSALSEAGIKLTVEQNRPGARVFYRATPPNSAMASASRGRSADTSTVAPSRPIPT